MFNLDAPALTPIYNVLRGQIIQGAISIDPAPPVKVLICGRWNVWVTVDAAFSSMQSATGLGLNTRGLPTQWLLMGGRRTSRTLAKQIAERAGMNVEGNKIGTANGNKLDLRLANLTLGRGRIGRHRIPVRQCA